MPDYVGLDPQTAAPRPNQRLLTACTQASGPFGKNFMPNGRTFPPQEQ
jgi:hypothetical protein